MNPLLAILCLALCGSLYAQPPMPMLTETTAPDLLTLEWNPVSYFTPLTYTLGSRTNIADSYTTVVTTTETNIAIIFPSARMEYSVTATGTNGLSSGWSESVIYVPPPPPLPVTNLVTLSTLPKYSAWPSWTMTNPVPSALFFRVKMTGTKATMQQSNTASGSWVAVTFWPTIYTKNKSIVPVLTRVTL